MGFTVTISGRLANPALTDATAGFADVHVGACLQFVSELFRARCYMLWHTGSYSGLLAPLIMDGEAVNRVMHCDSSFLVVSEDMVAEATSSNVG